MSGKFRKCCLNPIYLQPTIISVNSFPSMKLKLATPATFLNESFSKTNHELTHPERAVKILKQLIQQV